MGGCLIQVIRLGTTNLPMKKKKKKESNRVKKVIKHI